MKYLNKVITFLLILLLGISITNEPILAASLPDAQSEASNESILDTEAIETDPVAGQAETPLQTKPVPETEAMPETELVQETESAEQESAPLPETELLPESELQAEKEPAAIKESEIPETELPETETETETEAAVEEIKGYAGISLADGTEAGARMKNAGSDYVGKASLRNSSYVKVKAIDISEWNVITDWSKVKASGVQAVIIRVAGRYFGSGDFYTDDAFADNVIKAHKAGLKIGVYFFSQALNEKEAKEEADFAALKMQPYKSYITLPVFMDYEWDNSEYRLSQGGTVAQRTATVKAFCAEIKKKGYQAGLYASDYVLGAHLDGAALSNVCTIWIAHWGVASPGYTYTGVYDWWQYSASGIVPGMTGYVDLDYYYVPGSGGSQEPVSGISENIEGQDGIYTITSVSNPGYAVEAGSDGNLTLAEASGSSSQRFMLSSDSSGRYQIMSFQTGKVFDCQSGGKVTGTNVRTYKKNGTIAQTWLLQDAGDGNYYITAYNSGNKLSADSSMNLQLGDQEKLEEYAFTLEAVSYDSVTEGWYEIACASSTGYGLDISGGSYGDGANCQIYRRNGTDAQKFYIEETSDGYYRILCAKSGKVLDVSGGSTADYANIQQYSSNGSDAQKWFILKNDDDSCSIFSKKSQKCLTVEDGEIANKANLCQLTYAGEDGQVFKLVKKKTAADAPVPEKKYIISSAGNTSFCLDVAGGSYSDTANIQLYKKNSTPAQKFLFVYLGNGYYQIINDKSGKVLDVKSGSTDNKANIQQYRANGTGAQAWKVIKNGDGTFSFVNQKSGKCLDINGGKYQNNTNIWQYNPNGTKAQKFYLNQN